MKCTFCSDSWTQYDCMMYPCPEKTKWYQIKSFFSGDEYKKVMKHNKRATQLLMPRWKGFTPHLQPTCHSAEETLREISRVYKCVIPHLFEPGGIRHDPSYFREVSVFVSCFAVNCVIMSIFFILNDLNGDKQILQATLLYVYFE